MLSPSLLEHEGEGGSPVTGATGVTMSSDDTFDHLATKQRDTLPPLSYGSKPVPPKYKPVQKRAYKCACRRALVHGFTWYRGRCPNVTDFPTYLVDLCRVDKTANADQCLSRPNHYHAPGNRLCVLQWNASGMSLLKQDDIIAWLLQQTVDIVVLVETRWRFTNTWKVGRWALIHGGDPDSRGSGVMVMVNAKRFNSNDIGWTDVVAGHILHVRIHQSARPIDILACYQHVDDGPKKRWNARQQFWTELDTILRQLPNRNLLLVAGDFNCGVVPLRGQVGTETFRWNGVLHAGQGHKDTGQFMNILKDHGLVSLNSWDSNLGPTYIHGQHATRIDHVLTRFSHADGYAKRVQMLPDAEFVAPQLAGHIPMLCSLPIFPNSGKQRQTQFLHLSE